MTNIGSYGSLSSNIADSVYEIGERLPNPFSIHQLVRRLDCIDA